MTVAIPAADVRRPSIAYSISAQQKTCWPFDLTSCHDAYTRVPRHGTFEVVAG